jgi:hypothetical protein
MPPNADSWPIPWWPESHVLPKTRMPVLASSGRMVGKPYLTRLEKSSPSYDQSQRQMRITSCLSTSRERILFSYFLPGGVEIVVFAFILVLLVTDIPAARSSFLYCWAPRETDSNPVIASFQTTGLAVEVERRHKGWCCIYPEDTKPLLDQYHRDGKAGPAAQINYAAAAR